MKKNLFDLKNFEEIIKIGRQTVEEEGKAINNLIDYIDNDFAESVELIFRSSGRVIVTGIGKSANIAQKIVATLNSTGTPSIFMHAADAIHGDLGIIGKDDIVICISKSGNTPEIKVLVPFIKSFGNKLIALVSNADSFLAKNADFTIKATVEKEACPNNLAPTSSTTAQLVMGDALAVCLLEYRNFGDDDFAKFHPGGALGKRLYLRVEELYKFNNKPQVFPNDNINKVIIDISKNRLGVTVVIENNKICGIITDGDLRRMLEKNMPINETVAKDIMGHNPKIVEPEMLAIKEFELMKTYNITQLIVAKDNVYLGIVHLHDILKEGVV